MWRDEAALLTFVFSGAQRAASAKLLDWGDQVSTARWEQADARLPHWRIAVEKMRENGNAVPLRHPAADHASVDFGHVETVHSTRI